MSILKRLTLMFLTMSLFLVEGQQVQTSTFSKDFVFSKATDAELLDFFRFVMNQIDSSAMSSSDLSEKTKNRIAWMFENTAQNFTLSKSINGPVKYTIGAIAEYKNGKPGINVNLGYLVEKYWKNFQEKTPIDSREINRLIVMFSHEVIHLQHGPHVIKAMETDPLLVVFEERRTWAQSVIEDIRPLVEKDLINDQVCTVAQIVLHFCNDDMDCPAFKNLISGFTAVSK